MSSLRSSKMEEGVIESMSRVILSNNTVDDEYIVEDHRSARDEFLYAQYMEFRYNSSEYPIWEGAKNYVPPVLILIGTLGNLLAFAVLSRKHMSQNSVSFYLAVFALNNIPVLYIGCGLGWVSHVTKTSTLANMADWICKLWQFFFNVIRYTSTWLMVALAVDRSIVLWYPRKASRLCSVFVAKVTTTFVVLWLVVLSIHALWTYELSASGCLVDPDRRDYQTVIWPYIAATLYTYAPLTLLFIMDVTLIIGYIVAVAKGQHDSQQSSLLRVTILVTLTFLIMLLPQVIFNIIQHSNTQWMSDSHKRAQHYLVAVLCEQLTCAAHAFCFIYYFLAVPAYRQELLKMLRRKQETPPTPLLVSRDVNGDMRNKDQTPGSPSAVTSLL